MQQVHVVHIAAIGAQRAGGVEVIHRHGAPGGHDLVGIHALGSFNGLEVIHGGRVISRLNRCGHALGLVEETLAELARLVVQIPIPTAGELQAFGVLESQAVDVGDEQQQARHLHRLVNAEFLGGLDGIDGVATRIGQTENLCLGVLRLQQERREVRCVERVTHRACNRSALGLDGGGGVGFECLAKGIVGRQEEPALAASINDG